MAEAGYELATAPIESRRGRGPRARGTGARAGRAEAPGGDRGAALGAGRDRQHAETCSLGPGLAARSPWCCWRSPRRCSSGWAPSSIAASCATSATAAPSMATLVSLGTNAAFFFSVAVTLWPHVFHGAGRDDVLRDGGGPDHARRARALAGGARPRRAPRRRSAGSWRSGPRTARVVRGGAEVDVPIAGGRAPATSSASAPASASPSTASWWRARPRVDESMLTGESLPVDKAAGDGVFGGTVNRTGTLRLPRHPGRRGDVARPHRQARRGGAGLAGAHPAHWPTASPRSSSRSCSGSPRSRSPAGGSSGRSRRSSTRSPTPWRCWSSRARARWAWPPRPRSWWPPGAAPSTAC